MIYVPAWEYTSPVPVFEILWTNCTRNVENEKKKRNFELITWMNKRLWIDNEKQMETNIDDCFIFTIVDFYLPGSIPGFFVFFFYSQSIQFSMNYIWILDFTTVNSPNNNITIIQTPVVYGTNWQWLPILIIHLGSYQFHSIFVQSRAVSRHCHTGCRRWLVNYSMLRMCLSRLDCNSSLLQSSNLGSAQTATAKEIRMILFWVFNRLHFGEFTSSFSDSGLFSFMSFFTSAIALSYARSWWLSGSHISNWRV